MGILLLAKANPPLHTTVLPGIQPAIGFCLLILELMLIVNVRIALVLHATCSFPQYLSIFSVRVLLK